MRELSRCFASDFPLKIDTTFTQGIFGPASKASVLSNFFYYVALESWPDGLVMIIYIFI